MFPGGAAAAMPHQARRRRRSRARGLEPTTAKNHALKNINLTLGTQSRHRVSSSVRLRQSTLLRHFQPDVDLYPFTAPPAGDARHPTIPLEPISISIAFSRPASAWCFQKPHRSDDVYDNIAFAFASTRRSPNPDWLSWWKRRCVAGASVERFKGQA